MKFERLATFAVLILLNACLSPQLEDWPSSIPAMEYFVESYDEDLVNQQMQSREEYLEWVMVFYQGSLVYPTGWSDLDAFILPAANDAQAELLGFQIARLGRLIAAEWSKHNDVRRIDNRLLSLWGSVVQLSPTIETQQLSVAVIQQDVDALMNDYMNAVNIQEARYEEILEIDLFDGF